jgi:hypothetical protein
MREVVALCVGLGGLAIFTRMLYDKAIGAPTWGLVLVFWTVMCVIAAAGVNRIESLVVEKVGTLKVTLRQIEEAKTDVFAKADEVRKLTENVAEFTVWNARTAGRYDIDIDGPARLVKQRDDIAAMLRAAGTSEARANEIVDPLNDTVVFDLHLSVLDALPPGSGDPDTLHSERLALVKSNDRGKIEDYVRKLGNDQPELAAKRRTAIDRLEKFLKDKRF